jgi:epsilon-lactone hydrolase
MIWLLTLLIMVVVVFVWHSLNGEELSVYDSPVEPLFCDKAASAEHAVQEKVFTFTDPDVAKLSKKQLLTAMRKKLDDLGVRLPTAATITSADSASVAGEWVVAPGADPLKRLLYIHGGAFVMGSPQSHRLICSKFSKISGAVVFAVDYRLCPEHSRLGCLEDCQNAYRWLIANGPDGSSTAGSLYVAGDSAGGNLCLALLPWIRDTRLMPATAAVALSPMVDGTLSSHSIRNNLSTDTMLRPIFKQVVRTPRALLLPSIWLSSRVRPNDPRVSPIHGDLAGLPPLLIQASDSECLTDDARRYANKARAAGSEVKLELWSNMMHVWHIFEPELDEAKDAFAQIEIFLQRRQHL